VERTEDGVLLSATVRFDLPQVVDDALAKGIPMYFVAEAGDLPRPLVLVRQARGLCGSATCACPTSRSRAAGGCRCRRSRSATPAWCWARCSTAGGGAAPRCSASRAGASPTSPTEIGPTATAHNIDFRFRLDVSQLPRPFQIGAVGQADWNILARAQPAPGWRTPVSPSRSPPGPSRQADRRLARLRWAVAVGARSWSAIGIVLMFLLTQATNNRELYERNYGRLFALNMVVAGVLLAGDPVGRRAAGLALRRGKFGSRLLVKLAAIFALVGLVPGVLIYVVSYQFVSRSIESWFDVKVEGALDAGLNLGRATLDTLASDLANKTRGAAGQLAERRTLRPACAGAHPRPARANDVVLWGQRPDDRQRGQSRFQLNPSGRRRSSCARCARSARFTVIEGLDDPAWPRCQRPHQGDRGGAATGPGLLAERASCR
jgi:hypothetical protein